MSDEPTDLTTADEPPPTATATRRHGCVGDHDGGGRAVSYALGFVIVFSVAIAGTLALFVVGVDVLSDVDREEALVASEENLAVFHSEVGDMAAEGGSRRAMALELVDTQVRFTDETVRLRIEAGDLEVAYDTRVLRYEVPPHETTFVYAFGHVYRVDERATGGAVSERPPVFEATSGQTRLVVPVLTGPTADGPTEVGVSGTAEREFVALRSGPPVSLTRTGAGTSGVGTIAGSVTVEGTDHPSVWVRALDATGFESVERQGDTVTGEFESERLTVRQADIAVALGGESDT